MWADRRRNESGFTLIELLIATVVGGLILGAVGTAFIVTARGSQGVHERLMQSQDAQLIATNFTSDVQSADPSLVDPTTAVAPGTSTGCGGAASPGENLLRLQWTEMTAADQMTAYSVSYRINPPASASEPATVTRYYCSASASATGTPATPAVIGVAGTSAPAMSNPPSGNASTTLVVTKPADLEVGHLMVAHAVFEKGWDAGTNAQITPAGWTLVQRDDSEGNIGQAIFYRFADASDISPATTSYSFPFTQAVKAAGSILRITGANPASSPIVASSGANGQAGNAIAPGVNADANSLLLSFFGVKKKDITLGVPAGMTSLYQFQNPQDVRVLAARQAISTAGGTGTRTSTIPGGGEKWVAQNVVLRAGSSSSSGLTFPPVTDILAGATPTSKVVAHHLAYPQPTPAAVNGPRITMTLSAFTGDGVSSPYEYVMAASMRTPVHVVHVTGITRNGPETTNASSVSWTVTFSESVTGVSPGSFALAQAGGVSGATITPPVSGSGTTYTVTADTGSGDGTLGLNLIDNDTIVDGDGNHLGGTGAGNGNFTGQVYTITAAAPPDTTPPTVTIDQAAGQLDPTSTAPVNFTVVFSEAVVGFTEADVTLSGTAGGTKTKVLTGTGTTYNVAVSGATAGTLIATVAAGVAQDAAGNSNLASTSTDNEVTITVAATPIEFKSSATAQTGSGSSGSDAGSLASQRETSCWRRSPSRRALMPESLRPRAGPWFCGRTAPRTSGRRSTTRSLPPPRSPHRGTPSRSANR
jgi:prepilin-type N-terminal cleavage/methylation domain-containing protein